MPDPLRVGAYTASNNVLCGRGSGYARLCFHAVPSLYVMIIIKFVHRVVPNSYTS